MPARAASLKVTEAYRSRMIGLRNRAKAQSRKTWSKVKLEDLDATFDPGMLILHVSSLQKEAAQLSAGYLAAFISSETGEPPKLPVAMALQVNKARTGSSLSKAFRTPLIGVKLQIKDGKEPTQALQEGGRQLTETVGLAVDEAAREALRIASDQSPEVVGYQRAVKGTCEACMGLADGSTLPAGTELDIHPNCNCVAEPQVSTKDQGAFDGQAAIDQVVKIDRLTVENLPEGDSATGRFVDSRKAIEVSPDSSAESIANTMAHEYGHYIDKTLGGGSEYLTETTAGDPIFQILKNSQTMKAVRNDAFEILKGDVQTRNYLLQGKEMFARAFHQYVAIRSKNPRLLKHIRDNQQSSYMKCMVWQDGEFEPIAKALDDLFEKAGMAK